MANGFDWKTLSDPKKSQQHAAQTSDLIASLMRIDDAKIEIRSGNFKTINDLAAAIDVSIIAHKSDIDALKIYCSVTGREIGTRTEECLRIAAQIHGVEKAEELLHYSAQGAVSEHWIATAGRDLSKLAEIDPYGYFVFAASKAFLRHYHNLTQQNEMKNAEHDYQMLKQKIILFREISRYPSNEIIRANEAWRNFLSLLDPHYAKGAIAFPCQTLVDFGAPQIVKFLQERLTRLVAELVYKETRYKGRTSSHDVVRVTEKYKGLSTFRNQSRLNGESEGAFISDWLNENAEMFTHDGIIDYGSSWQRLDKPAKQPKYEGKSHTVIANGAPIQFKIASPLTATTKIEATKTTFASLFAKKDQPATKPVSLSFLAKK